MRRGCNCARGSNDARVHDEKRVHDRVKRDWSHFLSYLQPSATLLASKLKALLALVLRNQRKEADAYLSMLRSAASGSCQICCKYLAQRSFLSCAQAWPRGTRRPIEAGGLRYTPQDSTSSSWTRDPPLIRRGIAGSLRQGSRAAVDSSQAASPASKSAAKASLREKKKVEAGSTPQVGGAYPPLPDGWNVVIGIECHAQIRTDMKLFSREQAHFSKSQDARSAHVSQSSLAAASIPPFSPPAPPNAHVAPFDRALPGTLPQLNRNAVDLALKAALALECDIASDARFDRKHYFYHDLPPGYQITMKYSE